LCSAPIADLLRRYDDPLPGVEFEPGHAGWFRSFLDSLPTATVLLQPEPDDARFVDLRVIFVALAAEGLPELRAGVSLFESFPDLLASDFPARTEHVLLTGEPSREPEVTLGADPATTLVDVSIVRVGTLLALSWRHARS
jgi:hypothetical protein